LGMKGKYKSDEVAVQEAIERYTTLFNRSLDAVYLPDLEGRFIDANNAGCVNPFPMVGL